MGPQFHVKICKLQKDQNKETWWLSNSIGQLWIQSRLIQNHRSQINTSVSLNELKFLYLSTKVSLLLNLTGSRKWSSALQTKKQEKTMSILGTWILRTWLYTISFKLSKLKLVGNKTTRSIKTATGNSKKRQRRYA